MVKITYVNMMIMCMYSKIHYHSFPWIHDLGDEEDFLPATEGYHYH